MAKHPSLSIICYLIVHGKNFKVTNKRGQTVLNLIEDRAVQSFVQSFSNEKHSQLDDAFGAAQFPNEINEQDPSASSGTAQITATTVYCIVCSNPTDPISFPGCGCSCKQVCSPCASQLYRCLICNGLSPNAIAQPQNYSNLSNEYPRGALQPIQSYIEDPFAEISSINARYHNNEVEPQNQLQGNILMNEIHEFINDCVLPTPEASGGYPSFSNSNTVGPPQLPINQVVLTNTSLNVTNNLGNTNTWLRFKGSIEGKDRRLVDAYDNEYSRLTQRPAIWQCTKQGTKGVKSSNRCPATFKDLGNGNFSPGKALHTCRNKNKLKDAAGSSGWVSNN